MSKFAISIIGMKRASATADCLERMMRLAPADTMFFATSNGCPETAFVLRGVAAQDALRRGLKSPRLTVTENATNEGFQRPHNAQFIAAAKAGCQYVLIANDDIEVPERFLERLAEPMDKDPQVAITGPSGNCGFLNHAFHGEPGNGEPEYIEMSCGLIRVEALQRLRPTLWCPNLKFCYGEDSSLSLFVKERGYTTKVVDIHVGHIRSVTVNSDPEVKRLCQESQEHNHEVNRERWAYYLQHRRFDVPVVIKRTYAIGDCVLVEPIIRAIRKSRPLSPIYVQTRFPELFAYHPDVQTGPLPSGPCLTVDLDGAYESTVNTHIVDAYWQTASEVITGLECHDYVARLHPSPEDVAWAEKTIGRHDKIAILSTDATTWPGKNWPSERMQQVARWLAGNGWKCFAVGSKDRMVPAGWPTVTNLVGHTSLMQLAALCARAGLMVTPDTSSLHIAQAMGCPTVGLFGLTRARYITTRGSKLAAVESPDSLANSGIRHRLTGKTFVEGGQECMEAITVEQVIEAVKKLEL